MELTRSRTGGRRPLQPPTEAGGERLRTAGTERAEQACWPCPCVQHGPQKAFRTYIRFALTQFSVSGTTPPSATATRPEQMSTESPTDDRTNFELPTAGDASTPGTTAPAGRDVRLDAHPDVEIEAKPSAHCCGALGCRETDVLQEVTIDGYGTRVVCQSHAEKLIERETGVAP